MATPPPAQNQQWLHQLLLDIRSDLSRTETKVDGLAGQFDSMRKEYKEDRKDTGAKIENLQSFKHRVLGMASGISVAAGFAMSLLVNWVTRKF